MNTTAPKPIHGIQVMTRLDAHRAGFQSITTDISATREKEILASVCQHRNPERCRLIRIAPDIYQLAILREDVSRGEE